MFPTTQSGPIGHETWVKYEKNWSKQLLYNCDTNSVCIFKHPKSENLWPGALFFFSFPPSLPLLTPCNKPHWSYYTSSSSFLLLPVILPPSLCWKKSSSWFFSLKRAEANWILAALPFSGLWLQAEGGGRTGQQRGWRNKKERRRRQGKLLCGTFLKPALTWAPD